MHAYIIMCVCVCVCVRACVRACVRVIKPLTSQAFAAPSVVSNSTNANPFMSPVVW